MFAEALGFLKRNASIIITTHDIPDADGLGAEIAFSQICRDVGVQCRILNSGATPGRYSFMDPENQIGRWNCEQDPRDSGNCALVILDSSNESNIGGIAEFIPLAKEVFLIDHHEHGPETRFKGLIDSTASSTCEIMAEFAVASGVKPDPVSANALYTGMVYDTGFFMFPKTTARTFRNATMLVEAGVEPYKIYRALNENTSTGALLLRKRVLSSLEITNRGRVAIQRLLREDLDATNTSLEDAEAFVNAPLAAKDILVSVLLKESRENNLVRCSLRSKEGVNVAEIAQSFGGGGHVTASGFRSSLSMKETLKQVLEKISLALEKG